MKGEVDPDNKAYVQTSEATSTSITARVKIKDSGTYTVIGGYYKGECWHKGAFWGTWYYDYKEISGDAGDVFTVELSFPDPPMNTNLTVGVFYSIKSICTRG